MSGSSGMAVLPGHLPAGLGPRAASRPMVRNAVLQLSVVLRPRGERELYARAHAPAAPRLSRRDLRAAHVPPLRQVEAVARYFGRFGLTVDPREELPVVHLRGPVPAVEAALDLSLRQVGPQGLFAADRDPSLPADLAPSVLAVVGLDNLGRARRRMLSRPAAEVPGFAPEELMKAYGLPTDALAAGERLALLEFGSRFSRGDVQDFWALAGRAPGHLEVLPVAGGEEGPPPAGDVEATLDVEWAGAVAQGVRLTVLEAPAGDRLPFPLAVLLAQERVLQLDPLPTAASISYGDGEIAFGAAVLEAWNLLFAWGQVQGVEWFVASGDAGAYGLDTPLGPRQRHVDAPASSPHVVAVGGTRLAGAAEGWREMGWGRPNGPQDGASGGGVSAVFPRPEYQPVQALEAATGQSAGRGVPDVAANADPETGYRVRIGGQWVVVGGTSGAAPLWAAAYCLIASALRGEGRPAPAPVAPRLYGLAPNVGALRDILEGDNSFLGVEGYRCRPGWDAVTGLGSPIGPGLWRALGVSAAPGREDAERQLAEAVWAALGRPGPWEEASTAPAPAGQVRVPMEDATAPAADGTETGAEGEEVGLPPG